MERLTEEELNILNSKEGLRKVLKYKKINIERSLDYLSYEKKLKSLQVELIKLQTWVIENRKKIIIIFEGRDAAGKGGSIRRVIERLNPRYFRVIALDVPNEDEKEQWFFQRYVKHFPKPGEIVLFDRSWYNRAVVEPVNNFCTHEDYEIFMRQVNYFEQMVIDSKTYLLKMYFSISKEEQSKRFEDIIKNPLKKWKMTEVDKRAQELWDSYTKYKVAMFEKTNSRMAPWHIIHADKKTKARIEAIKYILANIPFMD